MNEKIALDFMGEGLYPKILRKLWSIKKKPEYRSKENLPLSEAYRAICSMYSSNKNMIRMIFLTLADFGFLKIVANRELKLNYVMENDRI
jgi:hypothetical protein